MEIRGRDVSSPPSQLSVQDIFDAGTTGLLLLILGSICQLFMVIVVGLRLYTKQTILRRWTLDDLWIVLAALLTTVYFAVGCYAVTGAASASIAAGHAVDPFYISKWLTEWVSALAFAFIKLSFYSLYMQIFNPIRSLRIAALIGAIYCTILWTILFGHSLSTTPKIGQSWADASNTQTAQDERLLVLVAGPFDVLSDIHILIIPLLGIRKLNLHGKKKAGVLALVLTGMLALAASVVSLYYRLGYKGDTPTEFSFYAVTTCVIIELQIGVSCASLPAVSALLRKKLASWDATGPDQAGTYTRGRHSQVAATTTRPTARSRTPKRVPTDVETGIKRKETEVTVKEVTRTDSDGLTVQGTRAEMDEMPRVHRMRAFSKSTRHSFRDFSPSPIRPNSRMEFHGEQKSTRASSRRGSLLRAASPWPLRRADSDENNPLAALGSNILVSTEVHQETRRSSMVDLNYDPHGDMQGVRTVIESPREGSRAVESQILEAMSGAYGSTYGGVYNNGHFPSDPRAGWLDR